jgi:hypothetical protein
VEVIEAITLMLGAAWAAGINLYATILVLGWMSGAGHIELPPELQVIHNPAVLLAAGAMYCVEFFADKIPGLDTSWDAIHTFIRIPVGALLAAGAVNGIVDYQATELVALILGGSVAAATHTTKASARALINTSPEPFSNWAASIGEDVAVIGGLWAGLQHPWWFLLALVAFLALVIWLLPKLWRTLRLLFRKIAGWFGSNGKTAAS